MITESYVAGVDEAGRGPLAGSVVAAAVVLSTSTPVDGLNDSKKLSEKKRIQLATVIKDQALSWSVAEASVAEIDQFNILHASMLAMKRAIEGLALKPDSAEVDGNRCPDVDIPCRAIVKGDATVAAISAASILAKVARDAQMIELDALHPEYGFRQHKGYPTRQHLAALARYGCLPVHRTSFAPVQRILKQGTLL
ncbi:MAG TPA: ribonuclease HII [Gammaproteobacteria bacterium]|nr:ribonuclease HII [Gammaproteobacteria bacterium]